MKATIPLAEGMAVAVEGDPREMLDLLVAMAEAFANGLDLSSTTATTEEPEDLGTMGHASDEDDAPPPAPRPPIEPPRFEQGCPECGSSKRHRKECSRSVESRTAAGSLPHVGRMARTAVQDAEPAPKKKIGRRPSIGGVALDDHAAPPPDYSDHGDLFDLPPLVFDGPDGERVVKDPKLAGVVHAHTFKLPPWSGHEETLGRCSCGATRRFRN